MEIKIGQRSLRACLSWNELNEDERRNVRRPAIGEDPDQPDYVIFAGRVISMSSAAGSNDTVPEGWDGRKGEFALRWIEDDVEVGVIE